MTDETAPVLAHLQKRPPRWGRRLIAISSVSIIAVIALRASFGAEVPTNNMVLMQGIVTACAALVGAYMTAGVLPDLWPRKV